MTEDEHVDATEADRLARGKAKAAEARQWQDIVWTSRAQQLTTFRRGIPPPEFGGCGTGASIG